MQTWSWDHQVKYRAALESLRSHEDELMSGRCVISLKYTLDQSNQTNCTNLVGTVIHFSVCSAPQ